MAKANFTKVEEALDEGLRKISIDKLHKIVDEKKGKKADKGQISAELAKMVANLSRELKYLEKEGYNPYENLKLDKAIVKKLIESQNSFNEQDIMMLKEIFDKVQSFRAKVKKEPLENEEEIIEKERKSQKTKRYNLNKNWLPLH